MMRSGFCVTAVTAVAAVAMLGYVTGAKAQQADRPAIQTTKVSGTDGVYVFRNGGHQSMFIVTPDGVIATDPVAYGKPTGGQSYVSEIRKVTDETVGDEGRTITLGGTTVELYYMGLNHSDSTLVMRLPKEKIIFVVDTIPVGQFPARGMIDFHPFETEAFIQKVLAMDWERLIPGHPGPGDRLGTKQDAQDQLTLLRDASAEMKKLAQDGKCWDTAEKEFKLPKYESWPGYANGLPFVARRYCGLWGRGT
jgi:glyoxylase-like metal-dependent hydrolase (beta-lactamase superfamily II)